MTSPFLRATVLAVLALAGCSRLPELDVEKQWADAIARQGMWAFFPLDEDVMVGDVFVQLREEQGRDAFSIVRIARSPALAVAAGLCRGSQERLLIADPPARAAPSGEAAAKAPRPMAPVAASPAPNPADCRAIIEADSQRASRMPLNTVIADASGAGAFRRSYVALPNLTVARLTEGQLGASGVFGNFAGNLGFGRSSAVALSIELRDLQQLQLENAVVWDMLLRLIWEDNAAQPLDILRLLAQRAPDELARVCRGEQPGADSAQVTIATRVLYAGGLTYNFNRTNQLVTRLALDASAALPNRTQPINPPALGTSPALATGSAATVEDLRKQLEALSTALAGGPTQGLGGNARLAIGSLGGSALVASFGRPLAVGAGSRLQFPLEEALLPRSSSDVADVFSYCAQVAGVPPRPSGRAGSGTTWCGRDGDNYVLPAGWENASPGLHRRLCIRVAERERQGAARSAAPAAPSANRPATQNFLQPSSRPVTGIARPS